MFNIILDAFENNIQHLMAKIKVRNDSVFSIHLTKLSPHGRMEESSMFSITHFILYLISNCSCQSLIL